MFKCCAVLTLMTMVGLVGYQTAVARGHDVDEFVIEPTVKHSDISIAEAQRMAAAVTAPVVAVQKKDFVTLERDNAFVPGASKRTETKPVATPKRSVSPRSDRTTAPRQERAAQPFKKKKSSPITSALSKRFHTKTDFGFTKSKTQGSTGRKVRQLNR